MKVTLQAVVVRNGLTNEVIQVEGITDMYSEVQIFYPHNLISRKDLIQYGTEIWGEERVLSVMKYNLEDFSKGEDFDINGEAKDIPSIGYVSVSIESKEVEFI
jgi:hypothetical protein